MRQTVAKILRKIRRHKLVVRKLNIVRALRPRVKPISDRKRRKMMGIKLPSIIRVGKIYRNDPCPCGSGAKVKHCCVENLVPKYKEKYMQPSY